MEYKTLVNRPKTKRGRETLNRILSAAAQVFYEKGYHNSSIHDITQLAGVASGTFYVYFSSKYDLYKFLLLQCSHIIRKHLNRATKDCKTRREVEEAGMRAWLKFVQENRYVYHIIWESLYIDKQLFEDYYVNFYSAYMRGITSAKNAGEIHPEINTEVLVWMLMGTANFLGLNWGMFKDYPTDLEQVVNGFMRILNGGIFTQDDPAAVKVEPLPIRIEVRFDDEDMDDDDETDILKRLPPL